MKKKESIRLSATKIIARDGFSRTKVQSIADDAEIAVGTVYIYFKNKDDILDYIFETQQKKIAEFSKKLEKQEMPPLDKIKKILKYHFKELGDNPNLSKVLSSESRGQPHNGSAWIKNGSVGIPEIFQKMLSESKKRGEIRNIDTELYGAIIFFIGIETAYLLQIQGKQNNHENDYNELVTFIVNGIESR